MGSEADFAINTDLGKQHPAVDYAIGPVRAAATDLSDGLRLLSARRRMRRYLRAMAPLFDALAIAIAFIAAAAIRYGDFGHAQALNMVVVVLPIFLVIAANSRAYTIASVARARVGGRNAAMAFLIAISAVGLVVFFLRVSSDFSRAVFGLGTVFAVIALPLARLGLASQTRRLFGDSTLCEVIIEDGVPAPMRAGAVVLDAERHGLALRLDDPMMLDRLGRHLINADRVIVACPAERRQLWAMALRGADVSAEIFANDLDELGAIGLSKYEGRSTLVVATGPLGVIDRSLKRLLDLTLTILSFPVTLPLLAAVAIAVRLDSPGPILFTQSRVGLGNRIFKMYKFRSMYADRGDSMGGQSTLRLDDRVTRVGRLIRATSLDELPQLFNVLTGAMSIVGPRPHPLLCKADDRLYWDIDPRYWHRHAMKPGLTGLAQVRGFRGTTEKESQFTDRLHSDLEYLAGWSIWRDLGIIFATFRVLMHRNAF